MMHQAQATGNLEQRIRDAEGNLFAAVGADVDEFFLELAHTGLRVRVLAHGHGPEVVLLHGVSESVLTTAELAAITTPTIFIIGSDDPYLSVERARPSIDQIQDSRLYEVPAGHAPWLVDAQQAAKLIARHLTATSTHCDEFGGRCPSTLRGQSLASRKTRLLEAIMRRVVLQFWISLDGRSCDEGTELMRVLQEMPDDEQWDEYFVGRRAAGRHPHHGPGYLRGVG